LPEPSEVAKLAQQVLIRPFFLQVISEATTDRTAVFGAGQHFKIRRFSSRHFVFDSVRSSLKPATSFLAACGPSQVIRVLAMSNAQADEFYILSL
jgi:hypothetical protein